MMKKNYIALCVLIFLNNIALASPQKKIPQTLTLDQTRQYYSFTNESEKITIRSTSENSHALLQKISRFTEDENFSFFQTTFIFDLPMTVNLKELNLHTHQHFSSNVHDLNDYYDHIITAVDQSGKRHLLKLSFGHPSSIFFENQNYIGAKSEMIEK